MDVGRILRTARQGLGLTQRDLAGRAGLSLGAVRDLEQGRSSHPRGRSVHALADVLQLDTDQRATFLQLAARTRAEPAGAGPVRISVLGPLGAARAAGPVSLGSGRHRVVLARLAITPGQPVRLDELIGLLWGADVPASAVNVVQAHVSRLRRLLDPASGAARTVTLGPGGYTLHADADGLDLLDYRTRLAGWRRVADTDPQRGFDLLVGAVDLWRGHTAVEDVPELHGDPLVTALSDELVNATVRLAHLGEMLRRSPEVLPRLRRLAARHALHEDLHARLIVALAASGQQAAALDAYDTIRRQLADELGLDPGEEITEARQTVLERRWQSRTTARPVREAPRPATQLPPPPPDFTGRAAQREDLEQLFRASQRRSTTQPATVGVISGMPGVGKTSLAVTVARALRPDFPDGQLYLDLRGTDRRPVSTVEAAARLLRALGVQNGASTGDAAALLRGVLADRRTLVILDNARSAEQVRDLLPETGGSAVLVTSRNRCAELTRATRLELPVLTSAEALDLLSRHVGAARATPDLAEACGRLPVALRLVAGRLAAHPGWTAQDIRERLGTTPTVDNPVTAGFDLSYRELPPRLARVFRTAGAMPGETVTPGAIAAALAADTDDVRADLDSLAGENLLQHAGDGRYLFHDLLRRYARNRSEIEDTGEDRAAALGRLARHALSRTASAMRLVYPGMVRLPTDTDFDPMCFSDVDAATLWLDEEIRTLVALIDAVAGGAHRARSWELADQLRGYFFVRRDAESWLATGGTGLAAAEAAGDERAQAAMHQTLGQAHWSVGAHEEALRSYQRGVRAARSSGWTVGAAYLMHNLGLVHAQLGRTAEAHDLYRDALAVGDGPEFRHIRAVTLNDLGTLCTEQGRLDDAVTHFTAALAMNDGPARRPSAMANRANLGMALRQLGRFAEAHQHLVAALGYYRETGSVIGEMSVLDELSQLHRQTGEWHGAVDFATAALRIAERLDDGRSQAGVLNTLGAALLGARAVTDAQRRFEEALTLSRAGGYPYYEAQAGIGVAETLLLGGDAERAAATIAQALDVALAGRYQGLAGQASAVRDRIASRRREPV
jgi:DNA-binding SARP family transcriptional activator/tetratricopeptide (TPR) repeat protein/DNA-binding XRE family transcriptional regulator